MDGHLDCLHLLGFGNSAVIQMHINVLVQVPTFDSIGYVTMSRIAGSCGNSMF